MSAFFQIIKQLIFIRDTSNFFSIKIQNTLINRGKCRTIGFDVLLYAEMVKTLWGMKCRIGGRWIESRHKPTVYLSLFFVFSSCHFLTILNSPVSLNLNLERILSPYP